MERDLVYQFSYSEKCCEEEAFSASVLQQVEYNSQYGDLANVSSIHKGLTNWFHFRKAAEQIEI